MREGLPKGFGLRAFGLSLSLDGLRPPGKWEVRPLREPILQLRVVTPETIAGSWSGRAASGWEAVIDGAPFAAEAGRAGDYRFVHGERSVCHLSADATLLQCAPCSDVEPLWWRVVLDSVLFSVALIMGYEALHAGAVVTREGTVAIAAGAGGGKSTLLAELLRRGHALLTDDIAVLGPQASDPLLVHPGPPLMNISMNAVDGLGSVVASGSEEDWVAVGTYPEAVPLAALVLLDRRPGLATSLQRIEDPLVLLMRTLQPFPRSSERDRARFELASELACRTSAWWLTADLKTKPPVLADLLSTISPSA